MEPDSLEFCVSMKAMTIYVSSDGGMFALDYSLAGNLDTASGELQ
jgi:hypothetical protein